MFKEEFSRDKFKVNHSEPEDFARCFWQKRPQVLPIWIVYRVALCVYFIGVVIVLVLIHDEEYPFVKNLIFYGYWCYFIELITFFLAFVVTVERFVRERKNPELPPMQKTPVHYKALWCLYTAVAPSTILVSIVYWTMVYKSDSKGRFFVMFGTHVFNSVFMVLDFFLYAIPYRFLHFYMPCVPPVIYSAFSIIYVLAGGTGTKGRIPIYTILDWRRSKKAFLTCILHVVCVLILHCVFYVMQILKVFMKRPRKPKKSDREATERKP